MIPFEKMTLVMEACEQAFDRAFIGSEGVCMSAANDTKYGEKYILNKQQTYQKAICLFSVLRVRVCKRLRERENTVGVRKNMGLSQGIGAKIYSEKNSENVTAEQ